MNKEIISTSCIVLIILLFQAFCTSVCVAESKINTNRKTIVIDPGHGGEDTGIIINSSLYEKTYTLKLAKLTAKLLKDKYTVLLTRERDLNLSILKRTSFANIQKADIFISLHAKKREANTASFIIFEPPQSTKPLSTKPLKTQSSNPWKKEQLKHIKTSKAAAKIFAAEFSYKFDTNFHITKAPALILQGAQMPALLIEALPMERLLGEADRETILQNHAKTIAKSLDKILK
ncbi:MAG: N-acetylmuramoyl-L-alanine amidase [Desulfobacteraceae bacterium]|nr:N-acetylmuramoyl-L-alanine amidase [Desulfobacteraceae bacterium]